MKRTECSTNSVYIISTERAYSFYKSISKKSGRQESSKLDYPTILDYVIVMSSYQQVLVTQEHNLYIGIFCYTLGH